MHYPLSCIPFYYCPARLALLSFSYPLPPFPLFHHHSPRLIPNLQPTSSHLPKPSPFPSPHQNQKLTNNPPSKSIPATRNYLTKILCGYLTQADIDQETASEAAKIAAASAKVAAGNTERDTRGTASVGGSRLNDIRKERERRRSGGSGGGSGGGGGV